MILLFFLFLGRLCNFSIQSSISCNDTICRCNFFVEQREVFRFKRGVRAVIMPFGLVSAWNKRRRSKSQDQTDPCRFFSRCFFFFNGSHQILFFSVLTSTSPASQGFTNRWSTGNSKINQSNPRKGIVDHQYSHSRRWRRQHAPLAMTTFLGKGGLAEFTRALCGQERYCSTLSNHIPFNEDTISPLANS